MKNKDISTEEIILKAAKVIFYKKGLAGSRMQEIADYAGINKALLHYYFRTKEKLFIEVLKQTAGDFFPKIMNVWDEETDFKNKIVLFIHSYMDFLKENMYLPHFIINMIYQNPEKILSVMKFKDIVKEIKLQEQLDLEYEKGNIRKVDAYQFLITIFSLCVFPVIAKPILLETFDFEDETFMRLLEERREIVPEIIFSWMRINHENK